MPTVSPAAASAPSPSPWHLVRRIAVLALIVGVLLLIGSRARSVHWHEVGQTLRDYERWRLAAVAGLAALSYLVFACYDLLGRAYARHIVGVRRVMLIAMVVYSFNLNFGGWIGSLGTRYRLYSHAGLGKGHIAGILGLALITNWLGFVVLGGIVLLAGGIPVDLPWLASGEVALGAGMLALGAAWIAACAWSRRRSFKVRGFHVHLPGIRIALLQLLLSTCNWLLMAAMVWLLLKGRADFAVVLGLLLAASMASLITHVPGGLGVIEALFVAALGDALGEAPVLGAIVAYRAIYFVAPLPLAGAAFAWLEAHARFKS
jgi:uncharacterized membrane protein YbhN (UPF0104 family)